MDLSHSVMMPLILKKVLTFADALSNIGGFMGLMAGISVLSIIQFFYHALLVLESNVKKVRPLRIIVATSHQEIQKDHPLLHFFKYLAEFASVSDVHGLIHITDSKQSRCGRIFWAVLVVLSLVFCSILIHDVNLQRDTSPVTMRIDSKIMTLDEVQYIYLQIQSEE